MSKEIIPSPGGSNKFSRLISKIKAALGIVENGNTASHTIASGKFVTWKGDLYKAKSAIPAGTTLSSSNLQAVSEGGLNELSEQIGSIFGSKVVTMPTIASMSSGTIEVANWGYNKIPNIAQIIDITYGNCVVISKMEISGTTLNITVFNPTSATHGTHDVTLFYGIV